MTNTIVEQPLLEGVAWETFSDVAYYDMWCVREVGERRWGHSFHMADEVEARGLVGILNTRPDLARENAALRQRVEDLTDALRDLKDNIGAASLAHNLEGQRVRAKADAALAQASEPRQ